MTDPPNPPPPMEFPRNLSYEHFLSLTPAPPPGPRPGQTCLYRGGEIFYADPAFIDHLDAWAYGCYGDGPIPRNTYARADNPKLDPLLDFAIKQTSPFRTGA